MAVRGDPRWSWGGVAWASPAVAPHPNPIMWILGLGKGLFAYFQNSL